MMVLRKELMPLREQDPSRVIRCDLVFWFARLLWRLAYVVLATGGILLRIGMIGPVGISRIWAWANALERIAVTCTLNSNK